MDYIPNIYPVLNILSKSKLLLRNILKMDFICQHCGDNFANKHNLKRHMARKHDSWPTSSKKYEKEEEESENETHSEDSDSENNGTDEESDKSVEDSESEDSDIFTYDEVRAILRYALQTTE